MKDGRKPLKTVDQLMRSRSNDPIITPLIIREICRRIIVLEKKLK